MPPTLRPSLVGVARWTLLAAIWTVVGVRLAGDLGRPWDFFTYYFAADGLGQGIDPYRIADQWQLSRGKAELPFLYPPIALLPFVPLTWLSLPAATMVWLGIEAILLALLVVSWRRSFLPRFDPLLLGVIVLLAFNVAAVWSLRSGNIALLEAFLLWTAFTAYAAERRTWFTILVVAASIWKLTPAFFLLLLLVPSQRGGAQPGRAAAALVVVALLTLAPVALGPAWARGFLASLPAERPWGQFNPSALGIIDTLLGDHHSSLFAPPYAGLWWITYALGLAALSVPALWRAWNDRDPSRWVMVAVMLYALIMPRMMIYSYVLVLVPVLILGGALIPRFGGAILIGLLVSAQGVARLIGIRGSSLVAQNLPFLMTLAIWIAYSISSARVMARK